jgi:hypothetical protein
MYDAGKIIVGIIIFAGLLALPVLYNELSGKAAIPPELDLNTPAIQQLSEKQCVEPTHYMKASHMMLLDIWRDEVTRNANRVYVASNGKTFTMSLTNTCLDCHSNKDKFCDRCHNYAGIEEPVCWSCHVIPEEMNSWRAAGDAS